MIMKKLFLSFIVLSILMLSGWSFGSASALSNANSICSASVSMIGQDPGPSAKTDLTPIAIPEKEKPFNWSGLIIGLLFLSFYGYAIAWIVITLIKTKRVEQVSKEEIIRKRKALNKSEMATDEENKQADAYLSEIFSSWKVVSDPGEPELRAPVTITQIRKSLELLDKAVNVLPTSDNLIADINGMANVLNTQQERSFAGSWKLIIVAIIACFITYLMSKSFDPGLWGWLKHYWMMPVGIILYYFASMAPYYLIKKRASWFKGKNIHNVLIATVLGIFLATPATESYISTWSDGSKTRSEEFNPMFFVMLIVTFMLILVLGFMTIIFAGINFLRNYVVYV
jgi:hypothetical protein